MNRRIIYATSDGGVSVVIPCRGITDGHLSDDEIFQRAWDRLQRDMAPVAYYREVLRKSAEEVGQPIEDEVQLSLETQLFMAKAGISTKPLQAINPQVVDLDVIPADRTFRNAWEHGGDKVAVNMDRARTIHLDRIREVRNAALVALDVETMKAVGKGDPEVLGTVEAQKQALRDIPQVLDLTVAQTPDELKAIWPEELK